MTRRDLATLLAEMEGTAQSVVQAGRLARLAALAEVTPDYVVALGERMHRWVARLLPLVGEEDVEPRPGSLPPEPAEGAGRGDLGGPGGRAAPERRGCRGGGSCV